MRNFNSYLTILALIISCNIACAQSYNYDFNTFTKIARIYTNNEIILNFNVLSEDGFAEKFKFENGYILEFENNEWIEKGFYNKNEIIYNKTAYQLKTNLIGRVFTKKKSDKNWTKVSVNKNTLTIEKNGNNIPEPVTYLVLLQNTQKICLAELEAIRKKREQERFDRKKEAEQKEASK